MVTVISTETASVDCPTGRDLENQPCVATIEMAMGIFHSYSISKKSFALMSERVTNKCILISNGYK